MQTMTTATTIDSPPPRRLLRSHIQFMDQMVPDIEIVEIKYKYPLFNEIVKQGHLKQQRAQVPRILDQVSAEMLIYFKRVKISKQKIIVVD